MRRTLISAAFVVVMLYSATIKAQHKIARVGHVFNVNVPEYFSKATGLNDDACFQYKCDAKNLYTFIIEDNKEQLNLLEVKFNTTQDFYDYFIKDFLVDLPQRKVGLTREKKVGNLTFILSEVTYYDEELKTTLYYHIGIIESAGYYYQFISFTPLDNKSNVESDLDKMVLSLTEVNCN